jgi:hypothetical protein
VHKEEGQTIQKKSNVNFLYIESIQKTAFPDCLWYMQSLDIFFYHNGIPATPNVLMASKISIDLPQNKTHIS